MRCIGLDALLGSKAGGLSFTDPTNVELELLDEETVGVASRGELRRLRGGQEQVPPVACPELLLS